MRYANLVTGPDGQERCGWIGDDELYRRYHDEEWGQPLHDESALFEKICLEGFQAGLSWITILRRREAFRAAFEGFAVDRVATFDHKRVHKLVQDATIIRHRGKIEACIGNARAVQRIRKELPGGLNALVWSFAPPARTELLPNLDAVPAVTAESAALSAELRRWGLRFVGPATVYALMQSAGLVHDHLAGCYRAELPSV